MSEYSFTVRAIDAAGRIALSPQTLSVYKDVLLLNMGGADGSTVFSDSSPSPKTINVFGDAQIDTSLGYNAGLFDGDGSYLSCVDAEFAPRASTFTAEFFMRVGGAGDHNDQHVLQTRDGVGNGFLFQYTRSLGKIAVASDLGLSGLSSGNGAISDGTLYHVALARDVSNDMRLFLDGTRVGDVVNSAQDFDASSLYVGRRFANDAFWHYFNGHIRAVRISTGCRYTTDFIPPTAPFPSA